ncbi:MAG: SH3 domain-containing protein [Pseudomonadota bacterium]
MKKTKRFALALLAVVLVLTWATAFAETQYVQRVKVEVKKGKGSFYPTIHTAAKGEALEVLAKEEGWLQVSTPKGPGWVYSAALSASKPTGGLSSLVGTHKTSELDQTAGFKGFDAPTEKAYVNANNLQREMQMVDSLERVPFQIPELNNFQKTGDLGQMGGAK